MQQLRSSRQCFHQDGGLRLIHLINSKLLLIATTFDAPRQQGYTTEDRTPHASLYEAHHGGAFLPRRTPMTSSVPQNLASASEQVQNLVDRGMTVSDRALAERTLTHVGFQRLSSYWQPFESNTPSNHGNLFVAGTQFRLILSRYLFDQRLRSHLTEAFSFIEVSIRTQWAHQLAHGFGHGDYAHRDARLFNKYHTSNLAELRRSYEQITNQKGSNFNSQTIWDVIHVMSFGQLSKWHSNLRDRAIRQAISQTYGLDQSVLTSALQHLTAVRNICAHHERLWNVTLNTGLRIPTRLTVRPENAGAFKHQDRHKVYNAIVMTTHLMEVITPNGDWPKRLLTIKEERQSNVPEAQMGFPSNWKTLDLWQKHL